MKASPGRRRQMHLKQCSASAKSQTQLDVFECCGCSNKMDLVRKAVGIVLVFIFYVELKTTNYLCCSGESAQQASNMPLMW